jgi:hypothetical protein
MLVVIVVSSLFCPPLATAAKSKSHGNDLKFRPIDRHTDPAVRKFADAFIRKIIRDDDPSFPPWYEEEGAKAKPIELIQYLEADLNDDGVSELILQLTMGYYCGTAGCNSYVFRRTPEGFEEICSPTMYDLAIDILPQKENGYHLVDAGESIIHWSDHRERNGDICREEGKPGYQ